MVGARNYKPLTRFIVLTQSDLVEQLKHGNLPYIIIFKQFLIN